MDSYITWPYQIADRYCWITWVYNKIWEFTKGGVFQFPEDLTYQQSLFVNNLNKNHYFTNYSTYTLRDSTFKLKILHNSDQAILIESNNIHLFVSILFLIKQTTCSFPLLILSHKLKELAEYTVTSNILF